MTIRSTQMSGMQCLHNSTKSISNVPGVCKTSDKVPLWLLGNSSLPTCILSCWWPPGWECRPLHVHWPHPLWHHPWHCPWTYQQCHSKALLAFRGMADILWPWSWRPPSAHLQEKVNHGIHIIFESPWILFSWCLSHFWGHFDHCLCGIGYLQWLKKVSQCLWIFM